MPKRKPPPEPPPMKSIAINTRKPDKWRFVDCDTGEVWAWNADAFDGHGAFKLVRRLNEDAIEALMR